MKTDTKKSAEMVANDTIEITATKKKEKAAKPLKPNLANIKLDKLHPFENHPYKVVDDDSMTELTQSIAEQGFLNRIIVRPLEDKPDEYEIISGHRRIHAAELLEIKEIPSAILAVDRDEATKLMVDSNIQRENISIMERGRAYRMKLDAIKRQGERTDLTSRPLVGKLEESADKVSDDVSGRTVQRYIRLTYLVPELQEFADEGKIKLRPGVELSYLDEEAQRCVVDRIDDTEVFPSHDQARRMRAAFEEGKLDYDAVTEIMNELKPNQVEKLKIPMDDIRKFFPKGYTPVQMADTITKLLEEDCRRKEKHRTDDFCR